MRILVCGGRDYDDRKLVWDTLDQYEAEHGPLTIIQGECPTGADAFAKQWAMRQGRHGTLISVPACWTDLSHPDAIIKMRRDGTRYDARAGLRRNTGMLEQKPDLVLAFPGNTGTADMVKKAKNAGIEVRKVGW